MGAYDLNLGCIFIGVVLNVWLYGFSCVQAYIYYSRFKEDKPSMRAFVGLLFAADTVNTILDIIFLYRYIISNFGNLEYASRANAEFATDPILVSMIGFMTQLFFAWRVWKLSTARFGWIVPMCIVSIGLASFLASVGTTVGVVIVRNFSEFHKFQVAVIIWLAGAATADAIITVSLIVTLHKARTGFTQTDDIISKLIRGTLQTGLLTASFAVIDLILFLGSSTTLHLIFNLPLAKLYVNSLLSTLNARAFAKNSRYTMNSSALRNMGGNNLKLAESGAIQSQVSAKGFNPISSNSEVTAVSEAAGGPRKPGIFKGRSGGGNNLPGGPDGVHVLTVEERFESNVPDNLEPMSYSAGRTPSDSRKTSEESGQFATMESLPMTNVSATPLNGALPSNHPYHRY